RVGHQPQNCEGIRSHDPAVAAAPRGSGNRVSPPRWVDESGKPRPTRPCSRCGRDAPIFRLRLEDVRRNGWSPFTPASFVNWSPRGVWRMWEYLGREMTIVAETGAPSDPKGLALHLHIEDRKAVQTRWPLPS